MKKIIAAFDGLKFSTSTRDYAVWLAKQVNTHLVGVFLDDPAYTSYKIYELLSKEGLTEERLKEFDRKDQTTRLNAAKNFEEKCQQEKLEFTIHHDHNIAIQDLKHESIYADLMVIDSSETLTHYTEKMPTRFIRELLADSQCPVILVPPKYRAIKKIVLLYDGKPSSVYAIKMFSYVLPALKYLETEIITVNPPNKSSHLPDNKLMKEFIKRHYPKATYTILKGFADDAITNHLKKNAIPALIIAGAYRRGPVSRWFQESMADTLMKELKYPLFIAHHR